MSATGPSDKDGQGHAAPASLEVRDKGGTDPLRECAREAIEGYLRRLDGHDVSGLYELAITEIEVPLFEAVLARTGGNQSRAAKMLGINRATLRKKLQRYGLIP